MTTLTEKQMFALLGVKDRLMHLQRHLVLTDLVENTDNLIKTGAAQKLFLPSGAAGLILNGGAAMDDPLRFTADFDISVYPPTIAKYSLPLARKSLTEFLDKLAKTVGGEIHPMNVDQDFYPQHYRDIAKKHKCLRYYVCCTLDEKTLKIFEPEAVTSLRTAIIGRCKEIGCEPPDFSKGIPFVVLIDAAVDSTIPLFHPNNRNAEVMCSEDDAFLPRLAYLNPVEEGVKKYFAILDESGNRNPMLFAKNLYDFHLRNHTANQAFLHPPHTQFTTGSGLFQDVVRCFMPIHRGAGQKEFITDFSRIDPEVKDNVRRVKKGLLGLDEIGMLMLDDESAEKEARMLLDVAWKTSEEIFGVSRQKNQQGVSYNIVVPDAVKAYWKACEILDKANTTPSTTVMSNPAARRHKPRKTRRNDPTDADPDYDILKKLIANSLSGNYPSERAKELMARNTASFVMHAKGQRQYEHFIGQ